jgi:Na+/H+ antiporter NhaD/arsenite permease-like protein
VSTSTIFSLIFLLILIFLVTERYHRSVAALLGVFLTIVYGVTYDLFPFENLLHELMLLIDPNTILLVVGVMILAEAVARTGLFEFTALSIAKVVGGDFRRISLSFMILTIIFSAFLSNITAMIIIGALTISIAKQYGVDPTDTILSEAILTNVGGLILLISSIPNLIVASHTQIGFMEFFNTSVPLVILLSLVTIPILYRRNSNYGTIERVLDVDPWSVVGNRNLFYRAIFVFVSVILGFIFVDYLNIPIGLISIGGAIAMLVLGGQEPESIYSEVDWGTVFFLMSFYIIIGGLEKSDLLNIFSQEVANLLSFRPNFTSVLNIWICGISSGLVDNIPITMTLMPVMETISEIIIVPVKSLSWGIIFGANLGGNLTPIGSPSNIIALGILKKEGKAIGWNKWFKFCIPLVLMQLFLASIYTVFISVIS